MKKMKEKKKKKKKHKKKKKRKEKKTKKKKKEKRMKEKEMRFIRNADIRHLKVEFVTCEIGRLARKHADKIQQHDKEEITQLLDNTQLRRLKRTNPFELCSILV
ncbi:hypothetical protein LSTR_LSTR003168 [Laodelphax striatellus]|uniref:Uncharacterized protein n=1 Tax=Laodelphax striatellus TaxID=195883 RepID=A0A482WVS7_LAOST|nr:hypothetical protein LSTR_LSTR003168 [Laodelphax striatellus]